MKYIKTNESFYQNIYYKGDYVLILMLKLLRDIKNQKHIM